MQAKKKTLLAHLSWAFKFSTLVIQGLPQPTARRQAFLPPKHTHHQLLLLSTTHHQHPTPTQHTMFRPNPKKAYKELRSNMLTFCTLCVAIRLSPYILHLAQKASK